MTLKHPEAQKLLVKSEFQLRKLLDDKSITLFAFSNAITRTRQDIIEIVCDVTGFPFHAIAETTRKQDVVRARQLLAYCLRRMAKMTYPAIKELFGYDCHSSAMHCEQEVVNRLSEGDPVTCSNLVQVYTRFEERDKMPIA